jgi:hypothetical protein
MTVIYQARPLWFPNFFAELDCLLPHCNSVAFNEVWWHPLFGLVLPLPLLYSTLHCTALLFSLWLFGSARE